MENPAATLKAAADLAASGEAFILITVVKTQGSTPRNTGARMIWRPETPNANGTPHLPNGALGTVGGGQFEHLVLDAARTCYQNQSSTLERFVLSQDADQCCGGVMEVFLEYHPRRARAVIFGAGHVGCALCEVLAPSPLDLIIVDDRPDWNSPDRFPSARRITNWPDGVAAACEHGPTTLAVVMTCSHDTDFDLLRMMMSQPTPPAFLGLIGSASKRACLFGRLVASGIDEARVQSIHCPIGVGDTGKEPRAVAISIAAQLLMEAKALAPG